jgi:FAD/FMN-containing dehydrogenase
VVTARGEVLTCTPDRDPLLFQMIHCSFGTLGILTRLTFRLVPALPYVKVTYEHHGSLASFQTSIRQHTDEQDLDFMDGIIHSPRHLVLSVGRFVADAPYANRYDWLKVYYRSTAERTEDYLRTPDYFFRYDAGAAGGDEACGGSSHRQAHHHPGHLHAHVPGPGVLRLVPA